MRPRWCTRTNLNHVILRRETSKSLIEVPVTEERTKEVAIQCDDSVETDRQNVTPELEVDDQVVTAIGDVAKDAQVPTDGNDYGALVTDDLRHPAESSGLTETPKALTWGDPLATSNE